MKLFLLFFILFLFLDPSSANADVAGPPDLTGWKVVNTSRIDVRISDRIIIYLGIQTQYVNPQDPNEFALVTKRHRPLIFAKSDPRDDRKYQKAIISFYTKKELQNILAKRNDEADTIIFQKWRVVKEPKTGQFVKDGDVRIWFLNTDDVPEETINQNVAIEPVSELRSADFKNGILAGVKYSVGKNQQIMRAEHVFLVYALKKEKK